MTTPLSVAVDTHSNLFVGTFGQGPDKVLEFASPYTGSPIATITNGINGVKGIDIDTRSAVFESNYYATTITKYSPPYTHPPALTLTNQLLNPGGISFGP